MRRLSYLLLLTLFLSGALIAGAAPQTQATNRVYLPWLALPPGPPLRSVNAPYYNVADIDTKFPELAVFWFGQVTAEGNYADVRVGYNNSELYVYSAAFDRRLWHPQSAGGVDLTQWDAVELLLDTSGAPANAPLTSSYRFVASLHNGGDRPELRRAYRGDGARWRAVALNFSGQAGWRGERLNDDGDDRGWAMGLRIPFSSLGLAGRPAEGSQWRLGLRLYDRDGAAAFGPTRLWPEQLGAERPASWGGLRFGLPRHTPPAATATTEVSLRHRLNGADVPDGAVGGGSVCGAGLDFWSAWGAKVYHTFDDDPSVERSDFNIQNQSDVADWPCFSKYYVSFPLASLPRGKVIVGAKLVLHQFGNANPAQAQPSLIQVLTLNESWVEQSLSWNNAPLAAENVAAARVDPLTSFPGWPGVAREFDISYAVAKAYAAGTPLHLALYSADNAYHSGKYFVSSDTGDWNARGRPTLVVTLGDR